MVVCVGLVGRLVVVAMMRLEVGRAGGREIKEMMRKTSEGSGLLRLKKRNLCMYVSHKNAEGSKTVAKREEVL